MRATIKEVLANAQRLERAAYDASQQASLCPLDDAFLLLLQAISEVREAVERIDAKLEGLARP